MGDCASAWSAAGSLPKHCGRNCLLEFRVCLATLCQPPRSDRTVCIDWRLQKKAIARYSCRGGTRRWPDATNRPGFAALCGDEAERLELADPVGERALDETRRQRRRPAPATDPTRARVC